MIKDNSGLSILALTTHKMIFLFFVACSAIYIIIRLIDHVFFFFFLLEYLLIMSHNVQTHQIQNHYPSQTSKLSKDNFHT